MTVDYSVLNVLHLHNLIHSSISQLSLKVQGLLKFVGSQNVPAQESA